MTEIATKPTNHRAEIPPIGRRVAPPGTPITPVGRASGWVSIDRDQDCVIITPNKPLESRCLIRPAALFTHSPGFPDVISAMGRMLFTPGATAAQRYTPYTLDSNRQFREVFLRIETTPDDAMPASAARWRNDEAVAMRLLAAAEIPWTGFTDNDVDEIVSQEPWLEPIEGCVLHALTQWTHSLGRSVIEIGSFRGQSLAMLARALKSIQSDAMLVSVDPHDDVQIHRDYSRLAVTRVGMENRLIQIPGRSDDAWQLLRPESASLIFIDGDHSYGQVVADFSHFRDILVSGGCMVFHDYGYGRHNGRPDVVPDVRPAIDRHVMSSEGFRPLLLAHTLIAFVKE